MATKPPIKSDTSTFTKEYHTAIMGINKPDKVEMSSFVEENTAIFAANEGLKRHVNELYDNLKPSQRRILLALYGLGLLPNKSFSKSSQVIGDALKKYHPHGEASLYGAMMFQAQSWRYNQTMVESSSNKGSRYNSNSYAGQRYTNVRLSEFAYDAFFKEWNPPKNFENDRITDYAESFSGYPEAQVLVARYPIFLLNWHKGYCTGRYTCTPGFRIKDACETIVKLLDDPDAPITIYPEDPRGCDITNKSELKDFFDAEYSNIKVRGNTDIEQRGNRTYVIIKTVPFEVNPSSIEQQIIKAYTKGKLPELEDIGDDTAGELSVGEECRLELLLKKGANPESLIEKLHKLTQISATYSTAYGFVNDMESVNYTPRIATLEWIRLRREFIKRILQKNLNDIAKRTHLLRGYIRIIDENLLEDIIAVLRKKTEAEASEILKNKMNFTNYQAEKIMQFRLRGITTDNMSKYKEELASLLVEFDETASTLRSNKRIDDIIRADMAECISKYDRPKRSKVYDLVLKKYEAADTDHFVVFTSKYVKKMPYTPAGFKIGRVDAGDKVCSIKTYNNRQDLYVFNSVGKASLIKVDDFSDTQTQSSGILLANYKITDNFVSSIPADTLASEIIGITESGLISRIALSDLETSSGKAVFMKVGKGDKLVGVIPLLSPNSSVVLYTSKGKGLLFDTESVTLTAKGVKGMSACKLDDGDKVVGIKEVPNNSTYVVVVTDRGYVKSCKIRSLPTMKRGEKCIEFNSSNGNIVSITPASASTQSVEIMTTEGIAVLTADTVPSVNRIGGNTRIVELPNSSYVIDATMMTDKI